MTIIANLLIAASLVLGAVCGVVEGSVLYDETRRDQTRRLSLTLICSGAAAMIAGGILSGNYANPWLGLPLPGFLILGGLGFAWWKAKSTSQRLHEVLGRMLSSDHARPE